MCLPEQVRSKGDTDVQAQSQTRPALGRAAGGRGNPEDTASSARRDRCRVRKGSQATTAHRALGPQQVRFEGRARTQADQGRGPSGDRLSGACRADLKPTKSIGAKRRCSINGCNNKREEGIAELIQIIWQIRIPAVVALPRRKGAGRPGPALAQAPGCP